ncbi:MAG: hypothetical protein OEW67_08205 [Cyclobacteriaceae bacterium]|nr:hypothetical protein [Cyclobacteriaceae bacterium]
MNCPTGKRLYFDKLTAEEALIEARIRFEHNSAITVYQCDDCGQWHLTSKGEMNTTLKELLENGTIKKEREALNWSMKFKRNF